MSVARVESVALNLRSPQSASVRDSGGTVKSATQFNYDYPLSNANRTDEYQWDSTKGAYPGDPSGTSLTLSTANATHSSWSYTLPGGINGNVVTATDANGNVTKTTYDNSTYGSCNTNNVYLYPKEVDAAYGKTEQRTTKPTYDCASGLLTSSLDSDNTVTTSYSYDNIGRQTGATQSGTGLSSRSTTTNYDDVNLVVSTTQDPGYTTTTYYDPLGRVYQSVDPAGNTVQKAYQFGPLGSGVTYELASNAFASSGDPAMGWTLTTRNETTGRTTVQSFSGAAKPSPWGSNSTATGTAATVPYQTSLGCSGVPATNVTDPANNTTAYCADGLGRMSSVTDANGNTTQYAYDALNNLSQAVMAGQTRGFQYTSLGRLAKACNPESATANCAQTPLPSSGLDQYAYDANGNLLTHTDARSTTTTFPSYDGLNRPSGKTYSDSTPAVSYTYDQPMKGTLSSVSTTIAGSVYSTAYTYDAFGRITASTQTTAGNAYSFAYTYDAADFMKSEQYPSGRTVQYNPDSGGRIQSVTNGETPYATVSYNAPGGASSLLSSVALGNGISEQLSWNDRQQLTGIAATKSSTNVLTLGLYPCSGNQTSCTSGNNGNIQTQTITAPGLSLSDSYTYDPLNRLTAASESGSGWSQAYNFDNNGSAGTGNMYLSPNSSFIGSFTPTASSNFNAKNQVQIQSSGYDSAGNQTTIGAQGSTFDAEGRMTTNTLGGTTTYVYDGEGQRVMKQTASGNTVYVYDASGNLAAEYDSVATQSACGTSTCYVTVDQLGSTRLLTDSSGNTARRYDYLPFGEEIPAGGSRTTQMGYQPSGDGFNPKFTGQVRDVESGLDYFNARYYSPEQGRFVGVDPQNAGSDPSNPQTWNGYGYVSGNPMLYTDPSGRFMSIVGIGGGGAGTGILGAALPVVNAAIVGIDFLRFVFADISTPPRPVISPIELGSTTDPGIDPNGDLTSPSGGSGTLFGSGNTSPFIFSVKSASTASSSVLSIPGLTFRATAIAAAVRTWLLQHKLVPNLSVIAPIPGTGPYGIPMLGVQLDVTYIPKTNQVCGSLGIALSPTGAGGVAGTVFYDPTDAAPKIVPGSSYEGSVQVAPVIGYSTTSTLGQPYMTGPSVGNKGIAINSSYGKCW